MGELRHCGDETEHKAHEWILDSELEAADVRRFDCVGTTAEGAAIAKRLRFGGRRVELAPAPIVWGSTLCRRKRCAELAVLAIDGEPYCLTHGDDEIERVIAVELRGVGVLRELPELDG